MALTGAIPAQTGPGGSSAPGAPGAEAPAAPTEPVLLDDATIAAQMGDEKVRTRLVTEAYGTQLPQRRVPDGYQK